MTKTFIKHDFQQKNMLNIFPRIRKCDKKPHFSQHLQSQFLKHIQIFKKCVRCGKFCEKLNQNGQNITPMHAYIDKHVHQQA